ncbi:hypothetical protein CC86DRAFT_366437, partial [Ophiobolus disseminans]
MNFNIRSPWPGPTSCLHLLRISRQIRAETLPLFKNLVLRLPLHDAMDYMRTLDFDDRGLMRQLCTKLIIDVPRGFGGYVNILPLIKTRTLAPNVEIEIVPPGGNDWHGRRQLKWKAILDELFGSGVADFAECEERQIGLQKEMQYFRDEVFCKGISAVHLKFLDEDLEAPRVSVDVKCGNRAEMKKKVDCSI